MTLQLDFVYGGGLMLLSELLNEGKPEREHVTEAQIRTRCPWCERSQSLDELDITSSADWDTDYLCTGGCGPVLSVISPDAPRREWDGPGIEMGGWKVRPGGKAFTVRRNDGSVKAYVTTAEPRE